MKRIACGVLMAALLAAPSRADDQVDAAVAKAVEFLVRVQEGEPQAEWPYEGVYRVRRQIPIGYRIGGTGIVGLSLIQAPGYGTDEPRQKAIARATTFVCKGIEHPLMAYENFQATYDVRGWGYAYGLQYLLKLKGLELIPEGQGDAVEAAIQFYLTALQKTEITKIGGWNYSRRAGFDKPAPPSPFMTGSTLQALFEAKAQGYTVDTAVVDRGLQTLLRARTPAGGYVYSGFARRPEPVPGSVGRMLIAESTLLLGGKGSPVLVRGALDAFFTHWKYLDQRRAKTGTHVRPYGVAPYYFYYAHYYAAQAIELLPNYERREYRNRLKETLFSVQLEDGVWNDRVFKRTANYGTAMTLMALVMKDTQAPAAWKTGKTETKDSSDKKPKKKQKKF